MPKIRPIKAAELKVGQRLVWYEDHCKGMTWDGINFRPQGYQVLSIDIEEDSFFIESNGDTEKFYIPDLHMFRLVLTSIKRNLPDWF